MSVFSELKQMLLKLCIDSYPSEEFESCLKKLKTFENFLRAVCKDPIVNLSELKGASDDNQKRFITSASVKKVLKTNRSEDFLCEFVIELLHYIVMSISKGGNDKVHSVLDYKQILKFVAVFKECFCDNKQIDLILLMFFDKILAIKREISIDNCKNKLQIFNIIKIIIIDLAKDLTIALHIIQKLSDEVAEFFLSYSAKQDAWLSLYYLECLSILSEIINDINFQEKATQKFNQVLLNLKTLLEIALERNSLRNAESFLAKYIIQGVAICEIIINNRCSH